MRQKAPRSLWKFIAAAARTAFIAFPATPLQTVALQPVFVLQMSDAGFTLRLGVSSIAIALVMFCPFAVCRHVQ